MKRHWQFIQACLVASLFCLITGVHAQAGPKALVLYDSPAGSTYEKLGMAYGIMLVNLLGHFDAAVTLRPVHEYTPGAIEGYDATFYLGSYYDNQLPASLLQDVSTTTRTVAWFKYNIWQLAWNPGYAFTQRYGMNFSGLLGLNAVPSSARPNPGFYDAVLYKNREFAKYYAYDAATGTVQADPEIGAMLAADSRPVTIASVRNRANGQTVPYAMRSGNFWYFADVPFSYIGPRDRYLVFADLLHDVLGIQHPESHRALVRLEDVSAVVSVSTMRTLTDFLYQRRIPFSIATIPLYVDPLGKYNNGIPMTVPLSRATNLKSALNYALARGGSIVEHGYTHQYSNKLNPNSGVSADDFEFWDAVGNRPVPEDVGGWALARMMQGRSDLIANGYTPFAWEMPHYQGSANANRASNFMTTYHRAVYYTADNPNFNAPVARDYAVGQFYPYVIKRDYYGQKIIPENLGNIEYDIRTIDPTSNFNYTWQDLYANAQYALAVRDGFASFFFHPFWLEPSLRVPGFQDFQRLVNGITQLGFTWTDPRTVD